MSGYMISRETISREVDEKSMLIKACNNTKGIGDELTMDLVKEYGKLMEVSNGKDKVRNRIDFIDEDIQRKAELFIQTIDKKDLKEAKTQFKLELPTASVIIKKANTKMVAKDSLVEYLKHNHMEEYIKESAEWGKVKKLFDIQGTAVINKETGEIVEDVVLETTPERVEVKY